ncbi:hypothetical protein OEIGOIKO_01307 [Streptomyces chrestomyceticus JCM 4735]|uniref:Uncharacterized protein n=1 Tax=Streptomyces chrestomyceticus JCM 4735 TaxID=1306181 RepID=A0A7U9KRR7_9ACTN|nr:hypothetical protein OEIGOIKO_01307 [Streptomyces chrestomyceticus JCM 4735]
MEGAVRTRAAPAGTFPRTDGNRGGRVRHRTAGPGRGGAWARSGGYVIAAGSADVAAPPAPAGAHRNPVSNRLP